MNSMRKAFQQAGVGGSGRQGDRPRLDHNKMTDYYDQDGCIRREVYVDWPKEIAVAFGRGDVTKTRIRRLYAHVLAVRSLLRLKPGESTCVLRSGLGTLLRGAEYMGGRKPPLPGEAVEFVRIHANKVGDDPHHFAGFFELFQSVCAYMATTDRRR